MRNRPSKVTWYFGQSGNRFPGNVIFPLCREFFAVIMTND